MDNNNDVVNNPTIDEPVAVSSAPISALIDGTSEKPAALNGVHDAQHGSERPAAAPSLPPANAPAFSENATLPSIATVTTPLKPQLDAPISEPSPAQTSPSDDAASDARPIVNEALPLDEPKHSHPTPPPDQPYPPPLAPAAEQDDEDAVMTGQSFTEEMVPAPVQPPIVEQPAIVATEVIQKPDVAIVQSTPLATDTLLNAVEQSASPISQAAPPEPIEPPVVLAPEQETQLASSLVRPREEDPEEDEPVAKRSRFEDEQVETSASPYTTTPVPAPAPVQAQAPPSVPEPVPTPVAETPAVLPPTTEPTPALTTDVKTDVAMPDAPLSSIEPSTPASAPTTAATAPAAAITPGTTQYYNTPMTDLQKSFLLEKTKNLKKTKHASAFLAPVDPVKLNIPNYPNIVKNPMDLGTLENKLKTDQYRSAQEYADDFNLIVSNTRLFNGDAHVVTIAAFNMEAYFKKYMSTLPGPQEIAQPKSAKRASPVAPRPQPRREARLPPPPPPAPASPAVSNQTFALQADGTPQIRRDSTTKRPHRTIKPPQNRELAYAKPKRKEHLLELKFCEHVLDEVRSHKYGRLNHIFQTPVDPVALNIPQYRQVVKKPMDLTTMSQKLKSSQYGTAAEFKADFELMINNCMVFNPPGNPVRDIGIEFRREFDALWDDKAKWERANKKTSERASSVSDESDEESEEDDEEEATRAAQQATIAALTKQLAELQKTVAAASQWGDGKKKKKDGKKKEKKSSVGGTSVKVKAAAKAKAPKKIKPLSYDEKQEISSAVGKMNEAQVGKLTQIITDNCEKYRNMGDDMELEIDDLPNDVQAMLLKHVRSIFGNPNRTARVASPDDLAAEDDDDYMGSARDRAGAGGKRKKHKPMGKKEQQENIAELRKSLAAFNNPGSDGGSPTSGGYIASQGLPANDTSGDEESEESEEE